jgi:hypothetical protein
VRIAIDRGHLACVFISNRLKMAANATEPMRIAELQTTRRQFVTIVIGAAVLGTTPRLAGGDDQLGTYNRSHTDWLARCRFGSGTKMWFNVEGAHHRTTDEVWQLLADARRDRCNLLLNIGPLGDGSIHPADVAALREVGRRLKAEGFPTHAAKASTRREAEDR